MIVIASESSGKNREPRYILNAQDFGSLRLVNKRTNCYIEHAFCIRFLRRRRHMLSEYSLEGLLAVSRHPLGTYVRQLSLGPERVPTSLYEVFPVTETNARFPAISFGAAMQVAHPRMMLANTPYPDIFYQWEEKTGGFEDIKKNMKHLLHLQEGFENSGRVISLLKKAFKGLTNLQLVSIESYPAPEYEYRGFTWIRPWGATKLVEQLDSILMPGNIDAQKSLCQGIGSSQTNWHLGFILSALQAITNRPDWEADFYLNSSEEHLQETQPIDVESAAWQACKGRVRKLSILRTIQTRARPHDRADWLTQLFKSCGSNVEALSCLNTFFWSKIACSAHLPHLRRLEVHDAPVQDLYFDLFLEKQADTLEMIVLTNVRLSVDEYARGGEDYPDIVLQSNKYVDKDASWIAKFEHMLRLPRLQDIRLESLGWLRSPCRRSISLKECQNVREVASLQKRVWCKTVAAQEADIPPLLQRAIRDNAIETQISYGFWSVIAWVVFLKDQDKTTVQPSSGEELCEHLVIRG